MTRTKDKTMSQNSSSKTCAVCQRHYRKPEDFTKDTSRWAKCQSGFLWFNCSCGSTLVLSQGKFPWYSPADEMSPTSQSLFNRSAKKKKTKSRFSLQLYFSCNSKLMTPTLPQNSWLPRSNRIPFWLSKLWTSPAI